MKRRCIVAALLLALLFTHTPIRSQGPAEGPRRAPDPFGYIWERYEGPGKFDNPLYVTHANDGSGRLFVVEQAGLIWIVQDDALLPEPFLDINALLPRDVLQGGYTERGLLGLAFHPQYRENGVFFVHYTDTQGNSALSRYRRSADDPNRADPASELVLLQVQQPYPDHNGGMIAFGPDGYLYLALGDGGGEQGDPMRNGQNKGALLAKILRLDVNDINAPQYAIPPDNPFVGVEGAAPEVWAYGLRNPWRFSFDRRTGDLYIGDVGWGNWEEVNFQPAASKGGENYGWNLFEGTHALSEGADSVGITMPFFDYSHFDGCSVTGGYVYRGRTMPELHGVYIFGDYCNGRTWMSWYAGGAWQTIPFKNTSRQISSFGEDEQGELYLVDYKGWLYRLRRV